MKNNKITLRKWCDSDEESLAEYANNNNIARFLTDAFPHPYSLDDAKAFISSVKDENPTKCFAIDLNGEAIGSIGIHPQSDVHRRNAEIGYFLAEKFWGQGIIPEAIRQIVKYGFETFDITRIYARPFGHNLKSQRVLKKVGFTLEARFENALFKNGEFTDELIYAIRK
jgi:Acetyltransferases, including N-acetylases of ribosomal proteins